MSRIRLFQLYGFLIVTLVMECRAETKVEDFVELLEQFEVKVDWSTNDTGKADGKTSGCPSLLFLNSSDIENLVVDLTALSERVRLQLKLTVSSDDGGEDVQIGAMETFETSHRSSPKLYEIKEDSVVSIPLCDLRRQLKASLRNLIVRHELSLKDIKALELQVGFYDLLNRKGSDQNEVLILATPFVLKEVSIHKLLADVVDQ